MTKPGKMHCFYMDLNNRRTGKDRTKPRALGLLGHSDLMAFHSGIRDMEGKQYNLLYNLILTIALGMVSYKYFSTF